MASSIVICDWLPREIIYPIGKDLLLKLIVLPIVPLWQIKAMPFLDGLPAIWSDHTDTLSR